MGGHIKVPVLTFKAPTEVSKVKKSKLINNKMGKLGK